VWNVHNTVLGSKRTIFTDFPSAKFKNKTKLRLAVQLSLLRGSRSKSATASSPVPVLRVLQISTKSVHFRSFTRTREHHQTGRKVCPVFGWSLSLSRRNIIFFRYRYSNTRATIIMTDWLQCFAFATSLGVAERRRVHCIPVQPKTGKFRALPFICALPLVVGALSRNRHV